MPIIYHASSKTFHLYNEEISYICKVLENGSIGQLYYGQKIRDKESFDELFETRKRAMSPYAFEGNLQFSLEHIKQEYPSFNHGDLRYPAFTIEHENGSTVNEYVYVEHSIYKGKKKITDLPAMYVEAEDEATSLEITLHENITNTDLILYYTIYETYPVICRHVKWIQKGNAAIRLQRALSICLDLPDSAYDMLELTGTWCRERHIEWRPLQHGIQAVYSMRGHSSHHYNPFITLKRKHTDETQGEAIGCALVYSGSFLGQVEVDNHEVTRLTMGIHPEQFCWDLKQNESFETPEAVLVYSANGLNAMSQTYHEVFQKRLARGLWRDKDRPILVNNWEATYMDFDEEKLMRIVNCAKDMGIELFVLDDGWFSHRDDDTSSLGDWYVNTKKLPHGITGLSEKVHDAGMLFGLWIEPEMINKKSDLYRQHPDWVMNDPQYACCHGRNQYVLDFSRKEVVDYIFSALDKVFCNANIDYIKWDMNRSMSEVFSRVEGKQQGKVVHEYILGVYRLYEMLIQKYPNILFESCASGGARFDAGMLYYAPQCWCSDDTDAIERIYIQYGTSMCYPISSIGAHVSAVPNHQLKRITPLNTRFHVACFGAFGYELDLSKMSADEQEEVKQQVAFMKKYRHLIQYGTFYRLQSPFETNGAAWMVVSKDEKQAIVGVYHILQEVMGPFKRLYLSGLDTEKKYHISSLHQELYGDELMYAGMVVSDATSGENEEAYTGRNGDFSSRLYVLEEVQ